MKNIKYICTLVLFLFLSSCGSDSSDDGPLFEPGDDGVDIPANCNVQVINVNRITADEVTEGAEVGDYFITLKSINTEKTSVTLRGLWWTNVVVATETSTKNNVGIDETFILRISSKDITSNDDFGCLQYFVQAKVEGSSSECEFEVNDC